MGIPNKTLSCRLSPEDWARIHVIRQLYGPHNNTDAVKLALQKAVPELFRSDNLESIAANMQALESMTLHDAVMLGKTGPKAKAKGAA